MDLASETEALLQGLAADPAPTDPVDRSAPDIADILLGDVQSAVEPLAAANAMTAADAPPEQAVQAEHASLTDSATASAVEPQPDSATDTQAQQAEPATEAAAPITDAETDASAEPAAAAPLSAPVGDAATNGVASTHGTAEANGIPAQTEPERGRSRKRRARWGAPANAPKEPAADGAAEGQTGRKKRRSRWEEPAPDSEEAQALTVIDTSGGSGFPHEIVLAGGIKVNSTGDLLVITLSDYAW